MSPFDFFGVRKQVDMKMVVSKVPENDVIHPTAGQGLLVITHQVHEMRIRNRHVGADFDPAEPAVFLVEQDRNLVAEFMEFLHIFQRLGEPGIVQQLVFVTQKIKPGVLDRFIIFLPRHILLKKQGRARRFGEGRVLGLQPLQGKKVEILQ